MDLKRYHVRDLNVRDVFIVPYAPEQKYFLFNTRTLASEEKRCLAVLESTDLVWWSEAYIVFKPDDTFWGVYDMWAPECHEYRGKYYLISSFRGKESHRGCQCLVADTPRGPFLPLRNEAVTPADWQCLDGTLYIDKQNQPWMVFCHEWVQVQDGQICAIKLKDDLSGPIGKPIILFRASDAPWKFDDVNKPWEFSMPQHELGWARVTDGPYLHRAQNGQLLMVWTSYSNTGYACGCARSQTDDILGPWVQDAEPLYTQDGGHAMLFKRFDGTLMMALHSPNQLGEERMLLFEMDDSDGRLRIINEVTGNWKRTKYNNSGNGTGTMWGWENLTFQEGPDHCDTAETAE